MWGALSRSSLGIHRGAGTPPGPGVTPAARASHRTGPPLAGAGVHTAGAGGGGHRPSRSTARPVNPPPARGEVRAPAAPWAPRPRRGPRARARTPARARRPVPSCRPGGGPRPRTHAPAPSRPVAHLPPRGPARAGRVVGWPPSPGSGARRRASPPFSAWRRPHPRPPPVRAPASGAAAGAFLAGRGGTPGR